MFLPYERRGRCLVQYRCTSPHRDRPCHSLLAAIYETPWGDIITAFERIPVPRGGSQRAEIKGTVPSGVQAISFYLDLIESFDLRCRRHRGHVIGSPGEQYRSDAEPARERSKPIVVPIPLVEWATD
jgi:hypothetical protein